MKLMKQEWETTLDGPATIARKREVEARLGAIREDSSKRDEREALKLENLALDARLREIKEQTKIENTRRNFAGIGSPLHEAIVERLPSAHVAELERAALAKLAERERQSAERKAAKALVDPPPVVIEERRRIVHGQPVIEVLIRVHMPRLAKRLSHRVYDTSAIRLFCRSLGMPKPPKGNEAHRAVGYVFEAVEQARSCAAWLSGRDLGDGI